MNDYLNIIAIQKNNEDIIDALKNIKPTTNDCLIFNNCLSKLKLAGKEIPLYFDKMLYSKENNLLVLIMQDSLISFDDIKDLLQEKNVHFQEYDCQKEKDDYKYNDNLKEFYFVNSRKALETTVKDSKARNQDICTYYPNICSSLEIFYLNENKECLLKRIIFAGAIELNDKLVLLVNQNRKRNINDRDIYATIIKAPLGIIIDTGENISSLEIEKKEKGKLKRIV